MDIRPCIICGANSKHYFSREEYTFYRCESCNFEYIHPIPPMEAIKNVYGKDYYSEKDRYSIPHHHQKQNWVRRIQSIEDNLIKSEQEQDKISILDIGCATGSFLEIAQGKGWNVYGIEPSKFASKIARDRIGSNWVENTTFEQFGTNYQYSTITAWAVLEHVGDPIAFLKKSNSILIENGILAFSTVNTSSLNRKLFNGNWRYYCPPEHLSFFNLKNIRYALDVSGFELINIRTNFVYKNFINSLSIKPGSRKNFLLRVPLYLLKNLTQWFNLGDVIEIIARKNLSK